MQVRIQSSDPNDGLWKAACARFGLTERLVGGTPDAPATPTWHVTFLAMCREVATMVKYSKTHNYRYGFSAGNLDTFMDLMDGYSDANQNPNQNQNPTALHSTRTPKIKQAVGTCLGLTL